MNMRSDDCSYIMFVFVPGLSPPEITAEFQSEVQQLRDCISVLFMFVRQPQQDQEFADNLHKWTEHLVITIVVGQII